MTKRLNHSRYLDYGARDVGDFAVQRAKETPTAKQRKFYNRLYAMCKSNGIDTNTGNYTRTRGDFAMAIDKLINRLQEHGVDIHGNNKDATLVISYGTDRHGRYYRKEGIEIKDREV